MGRDSATIFTTPNKLKQIAFHNESVCLFIYNVCMCVCDILDDNNNNPLYNREKNIGEFVENMLLFIEEEIINIT